MKANCAICTDLFDEINPISAVPCGHVYHTNCLTFWVKQAKTCPECRSHTTLKNIQKLYFNFLPKSNAKTLDFESQIKNLKVQLNAKQLELETCKKERDKTVVSVFDAENRADHFRMENSKLRSEISKLRLKENTIPELEAKLLETEQIKDSFTREFKHLKNVNGTQKDLEHILTEHAKDSAAIRNSLKRELLKEVEFNYAVNGTRSKLKHNCADAEKTRSYKNDLEMPSTFQVNKPDKSLSAFNSNDFFSENLPFTGKENAVSNLPSQSAASIGFNKIRLKVSMQTLNVYKSKSPSNDYKHITFRRKYADLDNTIIE